MSADISVLHLSTWGEKCGISDYAESLANALVPYGIDTEKYAVDRRALKYLTNKEIRSKLKDFCTRAANYDLVHVQHEFGFFFNHTDPFGTSISNFAYLLGCLNRLSKPIVVTFHSEPGFLPPFYRLFARKQNLRKLYHYWNSWRWNRQVASFFTTSHPRFKALVHTKKTRLSLIRGGSCPSNIETIPIGAENRTESLPDKETARVHLGYPADVVLLSLFGFISAYKGYDTALKALQRLPSQYHLAIVGGPHPEATSDKYTDTILETILHDKDLRDRVRITGYATPETVDLYCAATDVCLVPHLNVNQSGSASVVLAMSSGRPVIASRIPTFVEINEEADCFVMFAEEGKDELAWQIQRLIADPHLQRSLVRNAEAYIQRNSWVEVARCTREIYDRMLGNKTIGKKLVAVKTCDGEKGKSMPSGETETKKQRGISDKGVLRNVKLRENLYISFVLDPRLNDPLARFIAEKVEYPWDLTKILMLHLLRPGQVFLDLGCHIGTYSLAAAASGCRVLAVDGGANNIQWLRASAAWNEFDQLSVHHAAVHDEPGEVTFLTADAWGHIQAPDEKNTGRETRLRSVTVDGLLAEVGLSRVDLIKMDIEGSEIRAIRGMRNLLGRDDAPPILFESNGPALEWYGQTTQQLLQALADFGYAVYLVDHCRHNDLVPVGPSDVQPHAVSDYVACKNHEVVNLQAWQVTLPFTRRTLVERIRLACAENHAPYRRQTVLQIKNGPDWLKADPSIREVLRNLQEDPSPDVRAAAAWFNGCHIETSAA